MEEIEKTLEGCRTAFKALGYSCGDVDNALIILRSMKREEFPEITTVDEAIAAADEGFMSCKGARLMAREIEDLRALVCRASKIMSDRAASQVKAETIWRKDLANKGMP